MLQLLNMFQLFFKDIIIAVGKKLNIKSISLVWSVLMLKFAMVVSLIHFWGDYLISDDIGCNNAFCIIETLLKNLFLDLKFNLK